MPKKKSGNPRYMLSAKRKEQLKDELRAYKANPPLSDLAREYKVSHSTVSWHWRKVQAERKAKHATVKSVKDYNPKIMGALAHGVGTTLITSSAVKPTRYVATAWSEDETVTKPVAQSTYNDHQRRLGVEPATPAAIHAEYDRLMAKPNGHVTVTIAQEWLKPIVEEVARTEVRDFLQTAFRK